MARPLVLTSGDDLLHMLLAYRQVARRMCRCGREVIDKPIVTVHDHWRGPDRCDACHDGAYGADACPACKAEARHEAEDGATEIAMMVRHLPEDVCAEAKGFGLRIWRRLDRSRAIARMDGYVLRHLAHAARRGAYATGPSTLADTQELEVIAS